MPQWARRNGSKIEQVLAFDDSEHQCAIPSACLLASGRLTIGDRTNVVAPVMAGTSLEAGSVTSVTGDGEVGGNALIRDRGVFNGNLTLRGTLSHQNIFTVTGTLIQNDSPVIFALQRRTFPVGAGTPEVAGGAVVTLLPGTYGNMTFRAGSRVTLVAGTYNFASLNIEPDVRVLVTGGGVNVNVQGAFQLGDRSQVIAPSTAAWGARTSRSTPTSGSARGTCASRPPLREVTRVARPRIEMPWLRLAYRVA